MFSLLEPSGVCCDGFFRVSPYLAMYSDNRTLIMYNKYHVIMYNKLFREREKGREGERQGERH